MLSTHKKNKKKQREKEVHARLLEKRQIRLKEEKEEKKKQEAERRANVAMHGKLKPIRKEDADESEDAVKAIFDRVNKRKEVEEKLKHNVEILKAMQEEYDREQASREELNKKLEEQGNYTLPEKVEAMQKEVAAIASEKENLKIN